MLMKLTMKNITIIHTMVRNRGKNNEKNISIITSYGWRRTKIYK